MSEDEPATNKDTGLLTSRTSHDDVIKWKHFPRYWPFVRGIHRSPVNSPQKGQWRGAWSLSLICAWINVWVNNREADDLRCHCAHYDVIVVSWTFLINGCSAICILRIIAQVYRLSVIHCQVTRYSPRIPDYLTRYSVSANEISFDKKFSQSDCVFQLMLGLEESYSPSPFGT